MKVQVGLVEALVRYPVKSMRGEALAVADAGWHGLDGDRRLGLRRVHDHGGFPWLTASRLPQLLLFTPEREPAADDGLPTHVKTPEGDRCPVFGPELAADIGRRHGMPVEMVHLNRGIFDEASVSLIGSATVGALSRLAGVPPDVRRFRPNVVLATSRAVAYEEDDWVGRVLTFGEGPEAAAIYVTNRDERCAMVGLDPDTGRSDPELLRQIVRERGNRAGVYAAVVRPGRLRVGLPVFLEAEGG